MLRILTLVFLLGMSQIAIGVAAPDHPMMQDEIIQVENESIQIQDLKMNSVSFSCNQRPDEPLTFKLDNPVAEDSYIEVTISTGIFTEEKLLSIKLGDEIIEDSKKRRDRYILPIWDYIPIVEPPAAITFNYSKS